MDGTLTIRWARSSDIAALRDLMDRAIGELQRDFLTPEQIGASRAVMGLDTQLVADQTYCVVEDAGLPVGCGGWSYRATLYGGDHSVAQRNAALLDPAHDPTYIRAMYTHPNHVRRGVGRMVLAFCEAAARCAGFASVELMATMSGVPLYRAAGYAALEDLVDVSGGTPLPLVRMRKSL